MGGVRGGREPGGEHGVAGSAPGVTVGKGCVQVKCSARQSRRERTSV